MADTIEVNAQNPANQAELFDNLPTGTLIEIENDVGVVSVYIRPIGGGFPMVRGESNTVTEALRMAVALWEVR